MEEKIINFIDKASIIGAYLVALGMLFMFIINFR